MFMLRRSNSSRASRTILRSSTYPNLDVPGRPMYRFWATVRSGTMLSSWWMIDRPRSRACSGDWMSTFSPCSQISPPGSDLWIPVSTFMSVDLPAPFSPQRPKTSPGRRSRSTSDSAFTPGNVFEIPFSSNKFVTSHPLGTSNFSVSGVCSPGFVNANGHCSGESPSSASS